MSNHNLTSLDGLENLRRVDGDVVIMGNANLQNVDALRTLAAAPQPVDRSVYISYAGRVYTSLDFLNTPPAPPAFPPPPPNLCNGENVVVTSETPPVRQSGDVYVRDLERFRGCDKVVGELRVWKSSLSNMEPLLSLEEMWGARMPDGDLLALEANAQLSNLRGLANLRSMNGNLRIVDNPVLVSLDGLEQLRTLRGWDLTVANNSNLQNVNALRSLAQGSPALDFGDVHIEFGGQVYTSFDFLLQEGSGEV